MIVDNRWLVDESAVLDYDPDTSDSFTVRDLIAHVVRNADEFRPEYVREPREKDHQRID